MPDTSHSNGGIRLLVRDSRNVLQSLAISACVRAGTQFEPSGVWAPRLDHEGSMKGLSTPFGLLMDRTFLELVDPIPSTAWYSQVLGARDALFEHWINFPHSHSPLVTLIISFLCNIPVLLDIRFIHLFKINPSATLLRPLRRCIYEILSRPRRPPDPSRFHELFDFLALQVEATTGRCPCSHYVYLMLAQANGYVGRVAGKRALGPNRPKGVSPR